MARIKLAGFGRDGFIQDVAEYDAPPEAFNEVRNVRFNSIGAVSFSGHKSVLAPAPIDPLWLRMFPPVAFPRWVYADRASVYVFDDGHIDISRPGGYNGVLNERWQGEIFSGVGIFNNTVDVPQMWPAFNSATPLQDLTNWPSNLRCKFLRPFKVYLIAGFLTESGNEHPFRVRWSHPADPGTVPSYWGVSDPAYDSGEFELSETDDYLVDGRTLGEFFMVYKQKTAHAMYLTGNQRIFGQRTVISGRGALTRDCVQDIPGGHFVAGLDDIYVHSGQKGSEESVVEAKLRSWIFNQIDASNFFNCYTVDYKAANEVWFCFPESGETYPTLAFIWNKKTGGRGIRDLQRSPFIWAGVVDERTVDGDIWGGENYTTSGALSTSGGTLVTGEGTTAAGSVDFQTALRATGSIADGASFTGTSAIHFDTGSFSIEAWVQRNGAPDTHLGRIFTASSGGGDVRGYSFSITSGTVNPTKMRLILDPTGGSAVTFTSDDITLTGWNHCAVTVNRSTNLARFFLNGVFVNEVDISSVTASISTAGMTARILDGFVADVDELRIWNDVRSDAEIADNYDKEIANPELDSSLVAYFKFNEGSGTTTDDSSATGYSAVLDASGSFTTGPSP